MVARLDMLGGLKRKGDLKCDLSKSEISTSLVKTNQE